MTPSLITHPACGKSWTGLKREHCPACHETFSSTKAGDRHRRDGQCLPPASVGLEASHRAWGIFWKLPGSYTPEDNNAN